MLSSRYRETNDKEMEKYFSRPLLRSNSYLDARILFLVYAVQCLSLPKYEYQIVTFDDLDITKEVSQDKLKKKRIALEKKFNEMGSKGWSLSSCLNNPSNGCIQYIFQRLVKNKFVNNLELIYRMTYSAYPEVKDDLIDKLNISNETKEKLHQQNILYVYQLCKLHFADEIRKNLGLTSYEVDSINMRLMDCYGFYLPEHSVLYSEY